MSYTLYRGAPAPNLTLETLSGEGGYGHQMLGGGLYLTPDADSAGTYGEFVYELELDIPEDDILKLSFDGLESYGGIFSRVVEDHSLPYDLVTLYDEVCGATPDLFHVPTPPFVTTIRGVTYVVADCDLRAVVQEMKDRVASSLYSDVERFDELVDANARAEVEEAISPLTDLLGYTRIDSTDLGRVAAIHGYKVLWVDNTILPYDEVLAFDESLYDNGLRILGFTESPAW